MDIIKNILFIRSHRKPDIASIFIENFDYLKLFNSRLEYSLSDYKYRQINLSFQTIKHSIWINSIQFFTILVYASSIIWPKNDYIVSLQQFEQTFEVQRFDLVVITLVMMFCVFQCFWLYSFKKVISYQCSLTDCCVVNSSPTINNRFCPKFRLFLLNFYSMTKSIAFIIIRAYFVTYSTLYIVFVYNCIKIYQKNEVTLIQMIITFPGFFITIIFATYVMSQIAIITNFLIFIMLFIELQLKQLFLSTETMLKIKQKQQKLKLFRATNALIWNRFQSKYVRLYAETSKLNQTTSTHFAVDEFLSKSSIILGVIFYSQQTFMNLNSYFCVIAFMVIFCFTSGLYSRASRLPSYNQRCVRSIFVGIARSQMNTSTKIIDPDRINHSIISRYLIRLNLFTTIMTNNQFGFSCGRFFFITKFRYIQLLILNFLLLIKFYKRICLK